jgi:V/A-type H+-transporting ATPase subunit A
VVGVVAGREVRLVSQLARPAAAPGARAHPDPAPLLTGQGVFDLLYPVARGSTAAVPGGLGSATELHYLMQMVDAR